MAGSTSDVPRYLFLIKYANEIGERKILLGDKLVKGDKENPGNGLFPGFVGTSGDTELFEKPSNINGFRASEQKNILYIPPL